MRPKGKLFALFAVFAAIGLVTASGAFTTVQAERTADVNVAGDADALLAIQPEPTDNGDAYVEAQSNGEVAISLNGGFQENTDPASGINNNATTEVNNIINVTNQGSQTVYLNIDLAGDNTQVVEFYNGTVGDEYITGSGNYTTIDTGETVTISMELDTEGSSLGQNAQILSNVTFVADQDSTSL